MPLEGYPQRSSREPFTASTVQALRACWGVEGRACFQSGPNSVGGGEGAAKGLLRCFLVSKGNQPTGCTLALWWLKFGPTGKGGGGWGGTPHPPYCIHPLVGLSKKFLRGKIKSFLQRDRKKGHSWVTNPWIAALPATPPFGTTYEGKGKGSREEKIAQGGRGRKKGRERPMGTTAYGGKGSNRRAVSGDRPISAASCRPKHTMASCHPPF